MQERCNAAWTTFNRCLRLHRSLMRGMAWLSPVAFDEHFSYFACSDDSSGPKVGSELLRFDSKGGVKETRCRSLENLPDGLWEIDLVRERGSQIAAEKDWDSREMFFTERGLGHRAPRSFLEHICPWRFLASTQASTQASPHTVFVKHLGDSRAPKAPHTVFWLLAALASGTKGSTQSLWVRKTGGGAN